ncbi:MAG: L-2-amino-thiazoline-4-carboxylic acid hydrolase [Oscillospiraceae bacterium]
MCFNDTNYAFLERFLREHFGERGEAIFAAAEENFAELIADADYCSSRAIKIHMDRTMLPIIAVYKALLSSNFSKADAYESVLMISQTAAIKFQKNYHSLVKIPFTYQIFKLFCKSFMNKNYPKEGWIINWKRYDKDEISFDMKTCVYHETCQKYGCPELCKVFCANDTTTFAGLMPKIIFERHKTIGKGDKVCDFHFRKGKKIKEKIVKVPDRW